jgi:hypothetical protein
VEPGPDPVDYAHLVAADSRAGPR